MNDGDEHLVEGGVGDDDGYQDDEEEKEEREEEGVTIVAEGDGSDERMWEGYVVNGEGGRKEIPGNVQEGGDGEWKDVPNMKAVSRKKLMEVAMIAGLMHNVAREGMVTAVQLTGCCMQREWLLLRGSV